MFISKPTTAGIFVIVALLLVTPGKSQARATQSPVRQWQIDAGGSAKFDVVSVKQNLRSQEDRHSNVSLGDQDFFVPTGGSFSAKNEPLSSFIMFAYKLNSYQLHELESTLPKWVTVNRYDIEARALGNPSKNQYRMMMQALLADRFKLAIHFEKRMVPVFVLVLDKAGKLGPGVQRHPANGPRSVAPPTFNNGVPATVEGGFLESCGELIGWGQSGRVYLGARNLTIQAFAEELTDGVNGIDRPVLDRTGLVGTYDFVMQYRAQFDGPPPQGFEIDESAPTFIEAMKAELGMKLTQQKGLVDVLVIDHIEEPTPN